MYCVFVSHFCALFIFYITGSPKGPLLTSYNYSTWKDIVWSRLIEKGLSLYVDGSSAKLVDAIALDDGKIKDQQALGIIKSCVHRDLIFHITSFKEAKPTWDKLATLYGNVDEE